MKIIYIVSLTFLYVISLQSQSTLRKITQGLVDILPQEKIYLTFNKPEYHTGDVIYFSAFTIMADNHLPDSLSSILYVDILNAHDNKLLKRRILPLTEGITYGTIETDSIKNDVNIVAYTRWMLNFQPEFRYNKTLQIRPVQEPAPLDSTVEDTFNIRFFPEGGHTLFNIASKIAVEAKDEKGRGLSVSGKIIDETGTVIENFNTSEIGLGSFIFKPCLNKTYKAIVFNKNGKTTEASMPQPLEKGFTLTLDAISEKFKILAYLNTNIPDSLMPQNLVLLAHTRGLLQFGTKLNIQDKSIKSFYIEIPKSKLLYDGIVHVTLFDENGIPLCERLFFNENLYKRVDILVKTDKSSYRKREKVTLEIETRNNQGQPLSTELSLAVTDMDKAPFRAYSENILTYFLLRSDLGNAINNPFQYLKDTTVLTRQNLDLLMMTHGWRRFTWKQIIENKYSPPQFLPENGLKIKGKIFDKKKSLSNKDILLTLRDNRNIYNNQPIWLQTDSTGSFSINNLSYFDSTTCFIKVLNNKKEYSFTIEDFDTLKNNFQLRGYDENLNSNINAYLKQSFMQEILNSQKYASKVINLDTFTVKDKTITKRDVKAIYYDKPNASIKIEASSATNTRNLVEYLNGREGLRMFVSPQGGVIIYPLRGNVSLSNVRGMTNDNTPTVLIDGQPTTPQTLMMIPFAEVEKVDIIRSANPLFGVRGASGVINVITKNRKGINGIRNTDDNKSTNFPQITLKGFSIVKEFYSPNYDEKKEEIQQILDYRSAIYWNPHIKTDKNGKATVIFYNPDDSKRVNIRLEGYQKEGKLGFQTLEYSINPD